jgi:hypothetical protein
MKFNVSEDILKNTTKCTDNFSCLNGNSGCLCDIEDCSEGQIHFLHPKNHYGICEYKMAFGYSYTCNCPIRKEIYNHYNV